MPAHHRRLRFGHLRPPTTVPDASRSRRGVAVLGVAAALVAVAAGPAAADTVSGPDISSHQHPSGTSIDWAAVRASGQEFTLVKATEGRSYTNPYFAADWAGSRAAGLIRGAYHYARPSYGTATSQARHFVAVAGTARSRGALPPTLDLEETGGLSPSRLITWTRNFLTEVRSLTGRSPMIYTYPYFWRTAMANTTAFRGYRLWIASYSSSPTTLGIWSRWTFWQYSATSRIDGIPARVDMNRFNGTMTALRGLANMLGRPTVTASLSDSSISLGQSVTMTAKVSPSHAGQTVYRQGYYDGSWHRWATGQVGADGVVRFTIHPTVRAVDVYRIYVPAGYGMAAASSPTLRLTVR
jgi:GH25 family lysozyme M1 (1,4-beta-N-acetylmuramidase)